MATAGAIPAQDVDGAAVAGVVAVVVAAAAAAVVVAAAAAALAADGGDVADSDGDGRAGCATDGGAAEADGPATP